MSNEITIHGEDGFAAMRKAGAIVAAVLDEIAVYVKPGVTTDFLDIKCTEIMHSLGAQPAALGYKGYPKSICTSVNAVVCHGIPGDYVLREGDILNIDAAIIKDGWYGDSGRMYFVGKKIPIIARKLTKVTYESMMKAISIIKPGISIKEIGKMIQTHTEAHGFSVVRDFCGHGVGQVFHCAPNVLHYYDPQDNDIILQEGMIFTIEPMINAGAYPVRILQDGWTAVTKDHSLSAQFEHTIGVTKEGYEIFTLSPTSQHFPL